MQSLLTKDTLLRTYIRQYNDKEGIQWDYHNIKKNPGLCSLAKLMLNLFLEKMGQRSNLTWTTYIEDPKQFMDMMTSDQQQVKNVIFFNEKVVQLDWVHSDDFIESSCQTNLVSSIGPTLAPMTSLPIQDGGPHDFRSKMAAPRREIQDGGPTKSDTRWRPL